MKKITLLIMFLASSYLQVQAQTTFDGSNAYGRITNFVYDATVQNRIYATTLGKHIMVSEDNGATWNVFYTLPYVNYEAEIKNLRLTKNNTAISFAQYYGAGSSLNKLVVLDLQTKETVKEFSLADEGYTSFNNYKLVDNANLDTVVYLSNGDDGDKVLYTTNSGEDWTVIFDANDYEGVLVNDVAIDPNNTQKIFIARNGGPGNVDGGLLISTNGGQTWTEKLNGLILQSVAVNPANSNDIFVGSGVLWTYLDQSQALYRSLDGGETFTALPIDWQEWSELGPLKNFNGYIFNPNDPDNIIVFEEDQILITHDNGVTWENNFYEGGPVHSISKYYYGTGGTINPFNDDEIFINNGMYPLKSTDGGTTTTEIRTPFFTVTGDVNVVELPTAKNLYYGVRWGYVNRDLTTNTETPNGVFPIDETPNGSGESRMFTDTKIAGRAYYFSPGFMGNNLEVSNDFGVTRTQIFSAFESLTAVMTDPVDSNVGWFTFFNGESAFLRKINFNTLDNIEVSEVTLPQDDDYIQAFHIDAAGTIRLTVGANMFTSTDNGVTWTPVTNGLEELVIPNIGLQLTQNSLNSQQFTMAASNGIYTSVDNGASWTKIYNGFVNKVVHSDKTNGHIVGLGYVNYQEAPKVIYSNDNGTTWGENLSDTFYNAIVISADVRFNTETADVYIGTSDLGLLKQTIDFSVLGTPDFNDNTISFSLYPNPTNGPLTAKWSNGNEVTSLTVYTMTGQKVLDLENTSTLDMSSFTSGIYLVKAADTSGKTVTKRLIKK